MLLIFVKDHCLLKNNWTLISVNKSMLLGSIPTCGSWTSTTKSWCLHQLRLGRPLRRVQLTAGPPHLAPEGDQQFSAGCLASVLTH